MAALGTFARAYGDSPGGPWRAPSNLAPARPAGQTRINGPAAHARICSATQAPAAARSRTLSAVPAAAAPRPAHGTPSG